MADWDATAARLQEVVNERPNEYAPSTVANAKDVLRLAEERGWPIPEIGGGYWPTVCIWWDGIRTPSLEVFAATIEISHPEGPASGVWEYDHTPGQPFPSEFTREFSNLDQ